MDNRGGEMKTCPYCESEILYLVVIRESIVVTATNIWLYDKDKCPAIACPDCHSVLDSTDLGILGVPNDIIKEATQ